MEQARAVIHRTFRLEPRPGDVIRGDVRRPDGESPGSVIVVVHGFKGFKDWGFFPWACEALAEAGHAVVSFNVSHNGIGDDLLQFTELERFGSNTFSLELEDIRHVVDEIMKGTLLDGRPERLGLLGHSRGGGQAVLTAARDGRVDALATWSAVATFDRWTDEVKERWRSDGRIRIRNARTGQEMPLDVALLDDFEANEQRLDIAHAAGRITAPWLIVHGMADETVDVGDARILAGRAPDGRLLLVDEAGHTFGARHPFIGATAQLDEAMSATVDHFQVLRRG